MRRPAFLQAPFFYFSWLGLWLLSLLIFGFSAFWVVPGLFLFLLPGFLAGEKLLGPLTLASPGPSVGAILLGIVFSGLALLISGKLWGFSPLSNLIILTVVNLVTAGLFYVAPASPEVMPPPASFRRADYYTLLGGLGFLLFFILPAYICVGWSTANGYAYTQWFSLDFLISKSVVAALSHGQLPPLNPFYAKVTLAYHYWLHVLPAYLYQLASQKIDLETLLLLLYFLADAVFLTSAYLLFSEKLANFSSRLAAFLLLLSVNSFEGLYFLLQLLGQKPLKNLLFRNLEMIFIPSLLTPYLHLLYIVPHLFTAAYFYLIYRLLTPKPRWPAYLVSGLVLGASLGMSIFMGALLTWYAILLVIVTLAGRRKNFGLEIALLAVGLIAVVVWLGSGLKMYKKPSLADLAKIVPAAKIIPQERFNYSPRLFGLDRFILTREYGFIGSYIQIAVECFPILFFLGWSIYLLERRKRLKLFLAEIIVALSCLFAYLFIATDYANRVIAHKVSLPLYLFSALVGAAVWEETGRTVKKAWGLLVIFFILALPTLLINFAYIINVNNHWEATYVPQADYAATQWIKNNLPERAIVQCYPNYPAWPHQYSLIPRFAERNTAVGAYKLTRDALGYQNLAMAEVRRIMSVFSKLTPEPLRRNVLRDYQIDYLYFGPLEKRIFGPESLQKLQAQKAVYQEVYNQQGVVIFKVGK